ncbi:MAG: hypothetical protein M9906_07085 [Microthrixaceae bacterium]|nr:hypothetical protein [Microthrixaceae bacterium]
MGRGTGENVGFVRTVRAAVVAGAVLVVAVVSGCTVPSTLPDGSVPQVAPVGLNGMAQDPTADGGNVWAADYFGHQLLRFDPDTGRIAERYGGLCDTDDVVVAPDGSLIATCAGEGTVVRVQRDGAVGVLSVVGRGVNPIALEPGGKAVVVGFGTTDDDRLLRVPLDGGPVEVVADGLPVLNGFGFGPDGRLYAPTGGVEALLGSTGGLIAIDVSTGSTEVIPLQFDEPGRTGLAFAVGVDVGPDGTVYIAQGVDPALYAVDPATGHAALVGRSPEAAADNVLVLSDGRILLSGFVGNSVVVFSPDGTGGWIRTVTAVGS